jgi:DNA-binding MarR family transcriptional regulator
MMQETRTIDPITEAGGVVPLTSQSLTALLALAGPKQLDVSSLTARMKLDAKEFEALLSWLQREYLVDLVSSLEGQRVRTHVVLTDRGERLLVNLLEQICELPELR